MMDQLTALLAFLVSLLNHLWASENGTRSSHFCGCSPALPLIGAEIGVALVRHRRWLVRQELVPVPVGPSGGDRYGPDVALRR